MIIVDSREVRSGIPEMLRRLGSETEHRELPRGDYLIGQFEIERKERNDFTDRKFNRMRPSMARVLGLETRSAKEG